MATKGSQDKDVSPLYKVESKYNEEIYDTFPSSSLLPAEGN